MDRRLREIEEGDRNKLYHPPFQLLHPVLPPIVSTTSQQSPGYNPVSGLFTEEIRTLLITHFPPLNTEAPGEKAFDT